MKNENDVHGVPGAEPPVGPSATSPRPLGSGLSAPVPDALPHKPIKLRAWQKAGLYGEEDKGGPMRYTGTREAGKRSTGFVIYTEASEDPENYHWMQFTGQRDRTGRDIYEGDVVAIHIWKHSEERGEKALYWIDWVDTIWGTEFHWQHIRGYDCSTHIIEADEDLNLLNVEVIGNIYENPELLSR